MNGYPPGGGAHPDAPPAPVSSLVERVAKALTDFNAALATASAGSLSQVGGWLLQQAMTLRLPAWPAPRLGARWAHTRGAGPPPAGLAAGDCRGRGHQPEHAGAPAALPLPLPGAPGRLGRPPRSSQALCSRLGEGGQHEAGPAARQRAGGVGPGAQPPPGGRQLVEPRASRAARPRRRACPTPSTARATSSPSSAASPASISSAQT